MGDVMVGAVCTKSLAVSHLCFTLWLHCVSKKVHRILFSL